MPTQEERLSDLEKTVALLQEQSSGVNIRGLDRDVTTVFGMASRQELNIQDIKTSLVRVETGTKKQFESLGQTLVIILDKQDKRFSVLEGRFDEQDKRFSVLEGRFDEQDKRFSALESRFDEQDKRFSALESRFDGLEGRFDGLEDRFDEQDKKLDQIMLLLNTLANNPDQQR